MFHTLGSELQQPVSGIKQTATVSNVHVTSQYTPAYRTAQFVSSFHPFMSHSLSALWPLHCLFGVIFFLTMAQQPVVDQRHVIITLRHTTLGMTSLDEWSARRRDLYLTTLTTYTHAPGGIGTRSSIKQAASDPRHWPGTHWDRQRLGAEVETTSICVWSRIGDETVCRIFMKCGVGFKVCKFVYHHTFQTNQPTRCNYFSSLLLDVYVQLNLFRASSRPSSGAQQLQQQPMVLPPAGRPNHDQQRCYHHAPTVELW